VPKPCIRWSRALVALLAICLVSPAAAASAKPAKPAKPGRPAKPGKSKAPAALGARALREGASGADVRELQRLLRQVGIKIALHGHFDAMTKQAVQRFQRAAGLAASGTVGTRTVTALRRATDRDAAQIPSGGFDDRNGGGQHKRLGDRIPVKPGMQGHDIRVLQDFLRRAGVRSSTVDGEFGPRTIRAVRAFERLSNLPVNGFVDATDIAALRDLAGARSARSAPSAQSAPSAPVPAGAKATIGKDGLAVAPAEAPEAVKQIIAAGNEIARTPYRYGGGHARGFKDTAYDCSGSVSFALHGADLLGAPMASGGFTSWGDAGSGQWVTTYANGGHMYMVVAGIRFDTSGRTKADTRWQADDRSPAGYTQRHPAGL